MGGTFQLVEKINSLKRHFHTFTDPTNVISTFEIQ